MWLHLIYLNLDHWLCHMIQVCQSSWGQIVWIRFFLLNIPRNLLGLGWNYWSRCRSENQYIQTLGLPVWLSWCCYIWVGIDLLQILWCTQWWSILSLCLSPMICGLGIERKHSRTKRIPHIIQCPVVCHRLYFYLWRVNWKLFKGQGRLDRWKTI